MRYKIVDWDTAFFGILVARIDYPNVTNQELLDILFHLKKKRVQLVYWPANKKLEEKNILKWFNINLVDKKTTFVKDFRNMTCEQVVHPALVKSYSPSMSTNDVVSLAIQSGKYSRFAVDPHIAREKFEALYRIWMHRSLNKEIAEEVLVIQYNGCVVGMITLGNKHGRGEIGLLAVDRTYRRQKFAEKLIRAAQCWFIKNGYEFGQVITQEANIPACNLYKKCGYSIEKIEYYYHFWL